MINEIKRMQQLAGINEAFVNKPLGLASDEYYLNFFQQEMEGNEYGSEQYYPAYDELCFKLYEDRYGMTREEYNIIMNRNFTPISQVLQGAPMINRKEEREAIFDKYKISSDDYHSITIKTNEIVDVWKTMQKSKRKKSKLKTKFTIEDVTQILANNGIDDNYLEENEGVISGSEEWMDVSSEITGKDAYDGDFTDKDYKIVQNFISTMDSMGIELV